MSLFDKLRGEFIDIVEWTEPAENQLLAYRFPRYNNEIKYGAKLTVREGQAGVFVNEGTIADVYKPGMYTLQTENMPILATLKGWKYGFNSPFKAEVYFVSTKQHTDLKWGTQNPIMMRDPEFGPVRVRAFGTYALKVSDPGVFLKELVATDPNFEGYEIEGQLRSMIVSRFVDVIGKAKIAVLDLAGNYEQVGKLALAAMAENLKGMGLTLAQFYIENISMPPEVEAAIDKRTQMGVLGNLDQYTKFQTAEAIRDAAQNPGGFGGLGAGLGAGVAIAGQMTSAVGAAASAPATVSVGPPPLPYAASNYYVGLNGAQTGPFDLGTLAAKAREGALAKTSLVWKPGMPNWVLAETVAELQPLFAAVPPPLPPS